MAPQLDLSEPLQRRDVVELFNAHGYDGRYASTEAGLSGYLKAYLEDHNMFVSTAGSNKEKWERVVRDAVSAERHLARPQHYKKMPKHQRLNPDFLMYFGAGEQLYHNPRFQWFVAFIVCSLAHYGASQMYATPLPSFYLPISCSALPVQGHCSWLKTIMDVTYGELTTDIAKFVTVSFVQKFIDEWIVASVAPIKKKNL